LLRWAFSVMGASAKLLKGSFNAVSWFFTEMPSDCFFLSFSLVRYTPKQTGGKLPWLFFRGLMGTTSLYTLLYSILHMPLGTAMTYNLMSSLFIAIFGFVLFREYHRSACIVCRYTWILGMLMIYKPGSVTLHGIIILRDWCRE
jgi:drug/metabolite transporter (DMT)-like permease